MTSRALNQKVRVADAIVQVLAEAGIDTVFALPGGKTLRILDALFDRKDDVRTVMVRDEEMATIMAEAYGRLTGRPAVAMGQAAFMLSKAGIGILEAHQGSTPLLVLTDLSDGTPFSNHGPYQTGTGDYGGWDAAQAFRAYTKRTMVSQRAGEAVQNTQYAIKHAITGEPGPVAVCFHSTVFDQTVGPLTVPEIYPTEAYLAPARQRREPSAKEVEQVVARLVAAERPVILAGNGVRIAQAYGSLAEVAALLGAPVATTATGKGVFPEDDPLAVGVMSVHGRASASAAVARADLVLALGTKLSPNDTINEHPDLLDPRRQEIIQVDIEPLNVSWTLPVASFLVGDVAASLDAIASALRACNHQAGDGAGRAAAVRAEHGYYLAELPRSESLSGQAPDAIVTALSAALPRDAYVTCDAGENRLFMMHFFQTKDPGKYLQPGSSGGMGYAIPAALAAKLVDPSRTAVAVCGDGGFAMSMCGLLTAREENLPIIVVVLNNDALGWVKNIQMERAIAVDFVEVDYAAVAAAMGCYAETIKDAADLGDAVRRAQESGQPSVIEVRTSLETTHKDITSKLLGAPRTS